MSSLFHYKSVKNPLLLTPLQYSQNTEHQLFIDS